MNILFVTLYYPPLSTIASGRTGSMVEFLRKQGHTVHVVTRYFDAQQQKGDNMLVGYEESENLHEPFVEKNQALYIRYRKKNKLKTISSFFPPGIRGRYQLRKKDVHHYGWVEDAQKIVNEKWGSNKFDLIYSSYGPPASIMLGNKLAEKFNARHIVEFRDAYVDERDTGWIRKQKITNQQQLLKNVSGIVFSSGGMKDYFNSTVTHSSPQHVIYNGVEVLPDSPLPQDATVVTAFNEIKAKHRVVLLHTGTVYAGQDIDFFLQQPLNENTAIVMLGMAQNDVKIFQHKHVYVLPKVNQQTSRFLQKRASALLLPVWKGRYTGFSGKLLEYLYSGTLVLCSPGPQPDLLPFFEKAGNVTVLDNSSKWNVCIEKLANGQLATGANENKVYFTRNYWLQQLEEFILQTIK